MSFLQKKELCHSDSFSVCLKYIGLFCTVLLIMTATVFAAPLLKQGSEGHDVFILQQNLKIIGYAVAPDGIFGTTTFNAVIAFQREEDLPATGTVDRATWHAIQARAAQKKEAESAEPAPPPVTQEPTPSAEPGELLTMPDAPTSTDPTDHPNETISAKESIAETAELPTASEVPTAADPTVLPNETVPVQESAPESADLPTTPETTVAADSTNLPNEIVPLQESAPEPAEPPTATETTASTDSMELPNEVVPIEESVSMPEKETKSTSRLHPKPAALPAPKNGPRQITQTPVPEAKPSKSQPKDEPAATTPAQKPSTRPAPTSKKESPKTESKETTAPPKMEKVPEQAPFLPKGKVDAIIKTAKKYIGTRYIFGGTTPKGFDCSGFVQYVFKQNGFSLPRTADEQYTLGKRVKKRAELEPGDLVFFSTYEKGASHCGIYLGKNQFIHVSSSKGVRVDSLDNSYWKPRWYGGKHIVK